jgi:hypothetical protein
MPHKLAYKRPWGVHEWTFLEHLRWILAQTRRIRTWQQGYTMEFLLFLGYAFVGIE